MSACLGGQSVRACDGECFRQAHNATRTVVNHLGVGPLWNSEATTVRSGGIPWAQDLPSHFALPDSRGPQNRHLELPDTARLTQHFCSNTSQSCPVQPVFWSDYDWAFLGLAVDGARKCTPSICSNKVLKWWPTPWWTWMTMVWSTMNFDWGAGGRIDSHLTINWIKTLHFRRGSIVQVTSM